MRGAWRGRKALQPDGVAMEGLLYQAEAKGLCYLKKGRSRLNSPDKAATVPVVQADAAAEWSRVGPHSSALGPS